MPIDVALAGGRLFRAHTTLAADATFLLAYAFLPTGTGNALTVYFGVERRTWTVSQPVGVSTKTQYAKSYERTSPYTTK